MDISNLRLIEEDYVMLGMGTLILIIGLKFILGKLLHIIRTRGKPYVETVANVKQIKSCKTYSHRDDKYINRYDVDIEYQSDGRAYTGKLSIFQDYQIFPIRNDEVATIYVNKVSPEDILAEHVYLSNNKYRRLIPVVLLISILWGTYGLMAVVYIQQYGLPWSR